MINDFLKIKFAVFDMDGTVIRPGLLILDVMSLAFEEQKKLSKLNELNKIVANYKKVPFESSYKKFLPLLEGENRLYLKELTKNILESRAYPYAKLVIKKLREKYKIKTFMVSLTTDFVAEVVQEYFNFDRVCSVICVSSKKGVDEIVTGKTQTVISDAQSMKIKMLEDLISIGLNSRNFSFFFDSKDDKLIAERSKIAIKISESKASQDDIKTGLILEGKDPWEKFYKLL